MAKEDGGIFNAHVAGAKAKDTYHYTFTTSIGTVDRLDPYCRELADSECRVIDPESYAWLGSTFKAPSRETTVVYEVHIGSLAVDAGQNWGTFGGAQARMSELAALGINAVELMPAQAFGGKVNGWGYNPQLYFAPKPSYGSSDDLRALVDQAHLQGIAMWLDVVYNHTDGWSKAPL